MLGKGKEFRGTVKWVSSAITTSLAAAAHEDFLIRPPAGKKAVLQCLYFIISGPAGASSGTHDLSFFLTDGTKEIPLFQSDVVFGNGLNYKNDSSSDTGSKPDVLDRPLLTMLQNIVLTNAIYFILRYTNDTDVATVRARAIEICYREMVA